MDIPDTVFNCIWIALWVGIRNALLPASHAGLVVPTGTKIHAWESADLEGDRGIFSGAHVSSTANHGLAHPSQYVVYDFHDGANGAIGRFFLNV